MTAELPPLEPADVYLYAHANGAIFHADSEHWGFVTFDEALQLASAARQVYLGGDVGAPLADHVLAAVRSRAGTLIDHPTSVPPWEWHDGADALIIAAAYGQNDLLDDLIDRGADVNSRKDDGATPLHHAAAHGNLHALDRLLAAGAELDVRNDAGLTPLMAAQACGETAAAMRLEAAGATPSHEAAEPASFRWTNRIPFLGWIWCALVFGALGASLGRELRFVASGLGLVGTAVGLVLFTAVGARVMGGAFASWHGIVPTRFDGRRLHGTPLLRQRRSIDLDTVTAAAYRPAGGGRGARLVGSKLVLVHPEGRRLGGRALRRQVVRDDDVSAIVADDGSVQATIVILDPWWEHEVLRPLGTRLVSDPVLLTPRLRGRLRDARAERPDVHLRKQYREQFLQRRSER